MEVVSLIDARNERDGIITPQSAIENILANISDVKDIAVTIRKHDGEIVHSVSTMNHISAVGMFEIGKTLVLNDMWEGFE